MNIKSLKIGNLVCELPIIQGGMGVGISRYRLAAAVANNGGIGIISSAQIGYDEEDFQKDQVKANLRAIDKHIKKAKELAPKGIIGINVMVALNNYDDYVKAAVAAGIDLVISGAGVPLNLPSLVKGTEVKIAPIVSSGKAIKTILKVWDRKYEATADLVVVEGPRAGGHLGFSLEQLNNNEINLETIFKEVKEEIKQYEIKYNKAIPVVVAGGIFNGYDIAKYLQLGADGVQIATRFIATYECDAHDDYKQAYVNRKKEDIVYVKSPVGMPGRGLNNKFVEESKVGQVKTKKCYNCLQMSICDRKTNVYCITEKLIEAARGDVENGLLFCSDNAHRLDKIVSVAELMEEFKREINYS